ncbi:hypothetical protein Pint_30919 [Pistacia integerrima]|uniref:Uncharacterized protein n=1 Tax=Pistacia integerrima TaxID=434235 RepID=A0ACC0XPJ2_9ROSI|nr:hypothetical protein Pint_30919 [Pistacia integerrima]
MGEVGQFCWGQVGSSAVDYAAARDGGVGTLLERENNRGSNQARRLHYKRSSYWDDLPQELLEIISKSLNIVEYRNLGRVCRSWRLFYSEFKQSFLTSHSPLVVHASAQVNKYCYFFDIATGMEYKRKLPRYIWDFKFCLGVSSGYLNLVLPPDRRCFKGLFMGYKSFYRTSNPIPLHAPASLYYGL